MQWWRLLGFNSLNNLVSTCSCVLKSSKWVNYRQIWSFNKKKRHHLEHCLWKIPSKPGHCHEKLQAALVYTSTFLFFPFVCIFSHFRARDVSILMLNFYSLNIFNSLLYDWIIACDTGKISHEKLLHHK